jgi:uncharacterized delta-60 repeat protein
VGLRIEWLEDRVLLDAGGLDPTFGSGGLVMTNFLAPSRDSGQAVAVQQSDGKIVMAGVAQAPGSETEQWALARYNLNGTLDNSFGTGGEVTFGFGPFGFDPASDSVGAIAVQADGKIVVAGTTEVQTQAGSQPQFALARFNTNGTVDSSFGAGGTVVTNLPGGGLGSGGSGEVIQPDGKIIVVGTTGGDFAILRYNTDGTLDSTFGPGGLVTTSFSNFLPDAARGVVLQPDGKIVVVGGGGHLARYNPDGSLDATFGTGGKAQGNPRMEEVRALALEPNGQIVVAGTALTNTFNDFAVSRFNADGSLDANFGNSGMTTIDFGSVDDIANSLAVQPDGKIVVTGERDDFNGEAPDDFAVARLNTNGTLDPTFGGMGKVITDFGVRGERANAVVIQADGQIVVAGTSPTAAEGDDFALARYNKADGSLDSSFGNGGLVTTDFLTLSTDFVAGVAAQADGKIVTAGIVIGTQVELGLARYNLDGSLDSSFGSQGEVTTSLGAAGAIAEGVVIQGDGKIVVAVMALGPTGVGTGNVELARFNTDGSLDETFGSGGIAVPGFANGAFFGGLALQSDGKVVVVATSGNQQMLLARFDTAGNLDPTFAGTGTLNTNLPLQSSGVAIEPDGKILVEGITNTFFGPIASLIRFNSDGTTDGTYGSGGTVFVPDLNAVYRMRLAFQANGKLIISGAASDPVTGNSDFALIRLARDGSLDMQFGNNGLVTTDFNPTGVFASAFATDVAVQPDQRIVVAGEYNGDMAFARYLPNGKPDPVFGQGGQVTTNILTLFGDTRLAVKADGKIAAAGTGLAASGLSDFAVVQLLGSPAATDVQAIETGLQSAVAAAVTASAPQPLLSGSSLTVDEAVWIEDLLLALGAAPTDPQGSSVVPLVVGDALGTLDTLFADLESSLFGV